MPNADNLIPWLREIDKNKKYTNFGPLNRILEERLVKTFNHSNGPYLSTIANCTLGLELSIKALKLPPKSKILIPALTFAATGTAITRSGHTPIFSEVDIASWILTPSIALRTLKHYDFQAVIPVSTFGYSQDVLEWDIFTSQTGLPVLIDAAGAYGNQTIGQTTNAVFSMHTTKSLGAGEGGFVVSKSKAFIDSIRNLSNFGIDSAQSMGYISEEGTNAKLSEYHAAVALASLDNWERKTELNKKNYAVYRELLASNPNYIFQDEKLGMIHTLLPLRIINKSIESLISQLESIGIESRRWYYPLLNKYTCFRGFESTSLHNAELISSELIGLPFYSTLTTENIKEIVFKMDKLVKKL